MFKRLALIALAAAVALGPVWADHHEGEEGQMPEMSAEEMAAMQAWMAAGATGPQHEGLAMSAGDYDLTVTSWTHPGAEPSVSQAKAVREIQNAGRIMVETVVGEMEGLGTFEGLGITGYDNVGKHYWSTWTDSMSTHLSVFRGQCTDDGSSCTLFGSYTDPVTMQVKTAKTTITHDGDDEVFSWYEFMPDGSEWMMMKIVYVRVEEGTE